MSEYTDELTFDEDGLIPAIAQDVHTGEVRMLAYMNEESLEATRESGYAHYWSRSRQTLWKKGETSGNVQKVHDIRTDCDQDAILLLIEQEGVACHTGERNCFFHRWSEQKQQWQTVDPLPTMNLGSVLGDLETVIAQRDRDRPEGSYTVELIEGDGQKSGEDRVLEKMGEEMTELILSAKNNRTDPLREEIGDLLYHLLVLCRIKDLPLSSVAEILNERRS